ncbi:glycosyltransferase family 4 protein [Treponema socranskii]|uniref:glycosyltransferase family 4 protein n=1 Tax=Treponema socranskii TaxID=53419 RepID=UPI003D8E5CF2
MKKILFLSNTANFSKFNLPYMHWFREQGWRVDYCSAGEEFVKDCNNQYTIDIARSPFSLKNVKALRQLKKLLAENRYDILHCHTPMGGVLGRLAAKKLRQKHKIKIIYTAHGFHFYKGAPIVNWLFYYPVEKYLAKYTDVLVTINKEDYDRAIDKFGKITRIEYMNGVGVDLAKFTAVSAAELNDIRAQLSYSAEDFIITTVAECNRNKNQLFLIKRIPELVQKIPYLKVLIIGKETLPSARKSVEKMGLQRVCRFLGYRNDVELFEKMSNICFSASIREGLPVNIIEAMACGKVCVCSKNRGHNSLIADNFNGLLFDLKEPSEMINKILQVYNEPIFAEKISINAFRSVKKYNLNIAVKKMAEIYTSLFTNSAL